MRAVVPMCRTCSTRATAASPWSGRAWATRSRAKPQRYPVKITVFCDDRTGMLKELTAVISDDNTNIRGVEFRRDDEGRSDCRVRGRSRRRAPPEPDGAGPAPRGRRARGAADAEDLTGSAGQFPFSVPMSGYDQAEDSILAFQFWAYTEAHEYGTQPIAQPVD